jgi:hypothetical protein
MNRINAAWHRAHIMPKNPTDKQRAEWHHEYVLHCDCRAISPSIASLLRANGFSVPKPAGIATAPAVALHALRGLM